MKPLFVISVLFIFQNFSYSQDKEFNFSNYNTLFKTTDANLLTDRKALISLKLIDFNKNRFSIPHSQTEFEYRKNVLKDFEVGGRFSGTQTWGNFKLLDNFSVFLAYNVLKETQSRPALSVMVAGNQFNTRPLTFGYTGKIMLTKTIGELKLTLNYTHTNYEFSRTIEGHNNIFSGSLQYEVIKDKFFVMTEIVKDRDNYFKYGFGATFKISEGFWINAGIFRGDGTTFMLGFGFNF